MGTVQEGGNMNKECGICRWWCKEHCTNGQSKHCTEPRLEMETCGKWEFLQLSACPFCGGEAELRAHRHRDANGKRRYIPHIQCKECGSVRGWKDMPFNGEKKEHVRKAVAAWNRRLYE